MYFIDTNNLLKLAITYRMTGLHCGLHAVYYNRNPKWLPNGHFQQDQPETESVFPIAVAHNLTRFYENRSKTFRVIMLTDNRHWQKHHLLGRHNKKLTAHSIQIMLLQSAAVQSIKCTVSSVGQ